MEEYIKLNISFWDKILILFFGIIKKEKVSININNTEPLKETVILHPKIPKISVPEDNKMKYKAPLFFTDTEDVESNL